MSPGAKIVLSVCSQWHCSLNLSLSSSLNKMETVGSWEQVIKATEQRPSLCVEQFFLEYFGAESLENQGLTAAERNCPLKDVHVRVNRNQ